MSYWPLFHNGVAAGLKISNTSQVKFDICFTCLWLLTTKSMIGELVRAAVSKDVDNLLSWLTVGLI